MTRAPGSDVRLEVSTFGAPGAARVVVLLREDGGAAVDPDPRLTAQRDVRIVTIMVMRDEVIDPGAYGGETPASSTVAAIAALVDDQTADDDATIGLVGVAGAGEEAILLAGRLGARVDRLALIAVPRERSPLERHLAEQVMADVRAATLVVNGEKDPDAGPEAAQWHGDHIAGAEVHVVPADAYGPDRRLSTTDVWDRVLSHTAPSVPSDAGSR